jgi:glycosyltransferase involved in cell wall biosynthesis
MQSSIIIIIPHYNNAKGLQNSLLSIDEETNVDIIIIDDGSDEKPLKDRLICKHRTFFKMLASNSGIEIALNLGLEFALKSKYEFIGRLDCGDLCHKNKFTKQLNYLKKNKEVKLLGCWARVLDENKTFKFNLKHPIKYNDIKSQMYFNNTFMHPSVVFRSEVVTEVGNYPTNRKSSEDYAFFFKIIKRYKAENYPEILLDYIMSENSISNQKRTEQVYNRIRVLIDNFYFGLVPIFGIIRNLILLIVPVKAITFLKSKTYK